MVNELIAQSAWSRTQPDIGYWRDAGRRGDAGVDLVLTDGAGRTVGVEVKSSTSVRPRDAQGLLALRDARGLHRGFVVHQGADIVELAESIWAIPVGALSAPEAWGAPRPASAPAPAVIRRVVVPAEEVATSMITPPAASVFVTYVHADDEYERGAIRGFVDQLATTYRFLFGDRLEVFIDHDIRWGENWPGRIAAEIERTTFLLAVVTPSFLRSPQCREEVIQFTDVARRLGRPGLVLPLIWRRPPQLAVETDDLVVRRLAEAQWEDIEELRFEDPMSAGYRRRLEELATRLHETVGALEVTSSSDRRSRQADDDDAPDLLDLVDCAEAAATGVGAGFVGLTGALQQVGTDLAEVGSPPASGSTPSSRAMRAWATRTGEAMEPASARLRAAVDAMGEHWNELDEAVNDIIRWAGRLPPAARPASLRDVFDQIEDLKRAYDGILASPDIIELGHSLGGVAAMSRRLRPLARAVEAALTLISEMRTSTVGWLDLRVQAS